MTKPLITGCLAGLFLLISACGGTKAPVNRESSPHDLDRILPRTMAGMRGHRMLFDEGWFVVSSSRKAWDHARETSFRRSGDAMRMIAETLHGQSLAFKEDVVDDAARTYDQSVRVFEGGTLLSGAILAGSWDLARKELDFSGQQFQHAYERFVLGNISLVKRSGEELQQLKAVPGHYFDQLNEDFSNIRDLTDRVNREVADKVALSWEDSFDEAARAFRSEYDQSGTRSNSLVALGDVLAGYLKAFYAGLAEPGAKSIVAYGIKGTQAGLFLPGAAVTVISGRTIEATGLSLYYTTKMGYHVLSPTVEAGLLAGLSLVSAAAPPVTVAGGAGLSAINQVAFSVASPAFLAGKTTTDTLAHTGRYVARVSYDLGKGSSEVLINQASSAVVLGYNALTAIPVHLFLGTYDTVVLLCMDGPNLVLVLARGRDDSDSEQRGYSVGDLPAGTLVDLKKLEQERELEVQILTDDPVIIERVLERLPDDLRGQR